MNEMMTWVSPKTAVQRFEANDHVTACLNLRCMLPTEENKDGAIDGSHSDGSYIGTGGNWWYNEPSTIPFIPGMLHRENECGAGAGINPKTMHEYNNPDADITNVWLDGFTMQDGNLVDTGNRNNQIDGDSEKISVSALLNSTFTSLTNIWAKWTTSYYGTYTHYGWASWDASSPNFSN